jgi:hypothetical protein
MARINVLRQGTNRILCEECDFVHIRFEVRLNGYQLTNQIFRLLRLFNFSHKINFKSAYYDGILYTILSILVSLFVISRCLHVVVM